MPIETANTLTLVSHHLCPYVQRAAISLAEKGSAFDRVYIDLADKPDWFLALSPFGKVPVLRVAGAGEATAIFESAVILEYLEETQPIPLHPVDPLERARHRGWIEFGSSILNKIGTFYNAKTDADLMTAAGQLTAMFGRVERELGQGPWFGTDNFSLVDAVYGPIFRYFVVFDQIDDFGVFDDLPKTQAWRQALANRASVITAVSQDYPERLFVFLKNRKSAISAMTNPRSVTPPPGTRPSETPRSVVLRRAAGLSCHTDQRRSTWPVKRSYARYELAKSPDRSRCP